MRGRIMKGRGGRGRLDGFSWYDPVCVVVYTCIAAEGLYCSHAAFGVDDGSEEVVMFIKEPALGRFSSLI